MEKQKPDNKNKIRLRIAFGIVILLFLILIGRLFYIQVINREFYSKMAIAQQTKDVEIPAQRGIIYDRNMVKLAFSIKTFTIYGRPSEIKDIREASKIVADILEKDENEIYAQLAESKSSIVKLDKWVNKDKADLISNKYIPGVWAVEDNKRIYPYNNLASHVIGHTTVDNRGISGIEYQFNEELTGSPGKLIVKTDVDGRQLSVSDEKYFAPVNGSNIVLTIDEVIQHFTEKALESALENHEAKRVMAVVMDPKTGDVLSMAAKEDYNLNNPWDLTEEYGEDFLELDDDEKTRLLNKAWRNPNVSDLYEAGSTFKLITSAAGLEENVVTPNSTFVCNGYVRVYDYKIRCWIYPGNHGKETLVEGLENSCNPVFMEIGKRLGRDNFYKYIQEFGFNGKTGVDLPAESSGLVPSKSGIGPVELATMSFGHGFSATPLQVVRAVAAFGNNGMLMEPRIVKRLVDDEGNTIEEFEPKEVRQVVSQKTNSEILSMMESVVENGSGKKAYIPGIRIGGKTGTSEKVINGEYDKKLVFSSFVGIAPLEDPQVVILVIVDEPQDTSFGSLVAAPVAHDILVDVLRYLGIKPDVSNSGNLIRVPNVIGKTYGKGEEILGALKLKYSVKPSGVFDKNRIVINQYPAAGELVSPGSMIILNLEER